MNTTAKFGRITNNESFIDRFKTQLTENFARSQIFAKQKESQMNISQLQNPILHAEETVSRGTQHVINGNIANEGMIYTCPICDRLRAICPYKSYKTYQYCQKCVVHQQQKQEKKHQRPRIFSSATPSFSKELNSTLAETRGHSIRREVNNLRIDGGIRNMAQVDRVRFVQSNNVYPLGVNGSTTNNISQYRYQSKSNYAGKYDTKKQQRPRSTTQNVVRRPSSTYHHVINQQKIIPSPPNIEEIIFYPVIHNKIVYKSAQKSSQNVQELGQTVQVKRSRYQSNRSDKKSRREVDKAVSDFLHTTKPDQILTPFQFKKLADSIYRETNPNVDQQ